MRKKIHLFPLLLFLVLALATGCSKKEKVEKTAAVPNPHQGMTNPHAMMGNPHVALDDNPLPLKLKGINSAAELQRYLGKIKDARLKKQFDHDFRLCFTENRNLRDYETARADLLNFVKKMPNFAPAYRLLGYAEFNLGFNVKKSLEYYNKALEIDPNYGEVHYALAFMYVMSDLNKGVMHFRKAMALGIHDEHNLGPQYYDVPQK
jgi:tetratricopeptide (TPR) repeat protein